MNSAYALFTGVFLLLAPFATKAQTQYLGSQGELIGTSDSRMVVTIEEKPESVTLKVMAIGEIKADVFCFTLVYEPISLVLTDNTFVNDIPLGLNPGDFDSPVISLEPSFSNSYPTFTTEVMNHSEISTGMRSLKASVGTSDPDISTVMKPLKRELTPVFSIFFRKKVSGTALKTSDIGYYNNQNIPRAFPSWTYRGVSVTFAPGGQSESYYLNPDLFTYRFPSSLTTNPTTNIEKTTATLNGYAKRGEFAPANDLIVSGRATSTNTGKLDYDTIIRYGFIYSDIDAVIKVNGISKRLTIDGTDYDFPNADEIATCSFVRGTKTFNILLRNNTVASQAQNFFENLTGLTSNTTYYVWSVMGYSFQTTNEYVCVGNKETFTTKPKAVITATTTGNFDKTYDGNTTIMPSAPYILNGVEGNDDVALNPDVSFDFENANAGNNKPVTATNWTLAGADAGNYTLAAFPTGTTGKIAKAPLTVTAKAKEITYGDDPATAITAADKWYNITGFKNNEGEASLSSNPVAGIDPGITRTTPPGTYPGKVLVSGGSALNYEFSSSVAGTLIIKNLEASITFPALDNKIYGNTDFNLMATHASGAVVMFESLDPEIIEITGAEGSRKAHIKKAGVATIRASIRNVPNYADTETTRTVTVSRMAVAVRPDNATREYGKPNPPFTFSVSPVPAYGEPVSVLGTIAVNSPATATSASGQYEIIASGAAETDNYNITYNPGMLTILSTSTGITSITVDGQTAVKDGSNYNVQAACGESTATVSVTADANAIVTINGTEQNPYTYTLPNYGRNTVTVTVTAQNGTTETYTVTIDKPLPFDQIVQVRWNNTLTVINNPANNGGYTFTSYKWYRNGQEIGTGQSWSAGKDGGKLNPEDVYSAVVTAEGITGELRTCQRVVPLRSMEMKASPNPVPQGQTVYVEADVDSEWLEDAVIEIYSAAGNRVGQMKAQGRLTPVEARYPAGIHFFMLRGKDGFTQTLKVVIQ